MMPFARARKVVEFLDRGLWEANLRRMAAPKAFLLRALRIFVLSVRGFIRDGCQGRAAVLTYYSLLSVVPLVAVVFGIAKGFGLQDLVETEVRKVAEQSNWQAEVTNHVIIFSQSLLENTRGGLIAGVGVLLLFWTVVNILERIEESLDAIWEVGRARTLIRKFTDYMAVIVLAPILFIVASSATIIVAGKIEVILKSLSLAHSATSLIIAGLRFLPYLSIWALLAMLYIIMPNTRVSLKRGMAGAVVAGTIFQILQLVYIRFQIGAARYGAIYGSFAALPLFLVWLQISWMIILYGAEVSSAMAHSETFGFHPDHGRLSARARRLLALRVFHLLAQRFARGERPLTVQEISEAIEMPLRLVTHLLGELAQSGLVDETPAKGGNTAYQPARDIEDLTVSLVIDAYEGRGEPLPDHYAPLVDDLTRALGDMAETVKSSKANRRLHEIERRLSGEANGSAAGEGL
jgi:membrane protein